jgi:serine/threonine-protein kinase
MSETNATAPGTPRPRAPWLQRLLDEQQRRWQQGERIRVEDLLERHPELRQRPEAILDLIAQEIVLREQAGEMAPLAEYQGRFPHLREQLRDQFAAPPDPGPTARDDSLSPHSQEGQTIPDDPGAPPGTHSLSSGGGREELAPFVAPVRCQVPAHAIPGCDIVGVLGQGGMGLVLHGRDPDLGRDLAVKVLRDDHAHDPDVVRRFVEEAQIGGQLQHPGIVPVHALGRSADGRPYFTMKLVRGRTLAALLQERATPAQELPRFLGIFLQVCQTLAYAHSKGVIHRDLKPQNVMVGAFGEVQVMDWGLAKVLGAPQASRGRRPPEEPASVLRTVRTEQSGASSQAGSVLGTPAYMAPEQARGAVEQLDERCDVFGLGAILCEILTGQPPYTAAAGWQVYPRAVAADLTDALARLQASGAEAELLRLARNCLAVNPEERPRNAAAVADAMTAYLNSVAERLRQAELARAAAQVKAQEERKRRKLTVGLAAAVVGVVLVGGGSAFWLLRQAAERRLELRQGVEAALDKAAELQRQARWAEAGAVLDQAEHRLGRGGPEELRRRVRQAQTDLQLVDRLDAARLKAATIVEGQFDVAGAERDYAAAFRQAQLGRPGDDGAAVAQRLRASAIKQQLVAALDDWAWMTADRRQRAWLLAVARRADPDTWRDRFRDLKGWQDRQDLERLAGQAKVRQWSPQLVTALGRVLAERGGDAVPLLTAAQARHPHDFWLNCCLGFELQVAKRPEAAIGYYRAALALRPQASAVYNNLGSALYDRGDLDGAVACYHKALVIDPKLAPAHLNLGIALKAQGDLDGAIACYQKALAISPKLAPAHNNLGNTLKDKGALDGAIACYRKALAIDPKAAKAHLNLGIALQEKGALDGAIACWKKALALNPKDAKAHNNLGNALYKKGERDRAMACFEKALAIDPKDAKAHTNLGIALYAKGDRDGAIACFEKALALDPKDAKAHGNLGQALLRQGRFTEARDSTRRCLQLLPKRHRRRPFLAQQLRQCERLLVLDAQLPALLQGQEQPASATERLEYFQLCLYKRLYAAAARFAAVAIAADPKLATGHRYNAACSAALAGAGQGKDAGQLATPERARLRQQTRTWLHAELQRWRNLLATGKAADRAAVQQTLEHWQRDPDLAGLRDETGLAWLSEEERLACRQLWADVDALLKRAGEPK